MSNKIKIALSVLVVLLSIETWVISKLWDAANVVSPGKSFFYFDISENGYIDDFVSIEGSWTSDVDVYNPIQTSKIECWKDKGICVEANSYLNDNFLYGDMITYEIDAWNDKEIISKPDQSAQCTTYIFRIDRKQKQATRIRTTKSQEGICSGMSTDPIHQYLTDGLKIKRSK